MHVIITGGTGFIGEALTDSLVKDGHRVTILSRNPQNYRDTPNDQIQIVGWDAKTAQGWQDVAEEAEAIVNLAGETIGGKSFLPDRWTDEKKRRIRESRQNAGQAVIEAIAAATKKPRVIIQSSAIGYYGPRNDDTMLAEDAPAGEDFLASVCREWEDSTKAVEEMGVRRAVIRTGLILTPETGPLPRLLPIFRAFVGGPFGGGRQWWPWIHPEDEIRAIRFLLENDRASGPFNLVAPEPVTNRMFSKELGQALGRPSLIPVPGFAVKLLVGEAATIVLDGQRAVPTGLQKLGFTFSFPNLTGAFNQILK